MQVQHHRKGVSSNCLGNTEIPSLSVWERVYTSNGSSTLDILESNEVFKRPHHEVGNVSTELSDENGIHQRIGKRRSGLFEQSLLRTLVTYYGRLRSYF